ncbi:MAG: hypothetical protein F4017_01700 [Acidimicrobiaceae bacterium]|nr:hypothetical protein [Acidimicrobiaceae bacterium]MYH42884.1 hypothetical protein [Acidimicrobiaceae bacterium]MYK73297.1 hypothetical protein [Acidimicrobiaceae bacterium]
MATTFEQNHVESIDGELKLLVGHLGLGASHLNDHLLELLEREAASSRALPHPLPTRTRSPTR